MSSYDFVQELRVAARTTFRRPAFFLIATATLALGIGATSAVYAVVESVILRPLPYPTPQRIVLVRDRLTDSSGTEGLLSPGRYLDFASQNRSFESLGAFTDSLYNVGGGGRMVERIYALKVTPSVLDVLGVKPAQGRSFSDSEWKLGAEQSKVMLVSGRLWARRFGSVAFSPQSVHLGKERYEIIGVLPSDFFYWGPTVDAVLPLQFSSLDQGSRRAFRYLTVVGRLKPTLSTAVAQEDLSRIARGLSQIFPQTDGGRTVVLSQLSSVVLKDAYGGLILLFVSAGTLLFISCSNVAGILVSWSIDRRRDTAVRLALGGSRKNVFRQFLWEGVVISVASAVLGLLLARIALAVFLVVGPADLPRLQNSALNWSTAVFGLILAGIAAVLITLVPFRQARSVHLSEALRASGTASSSTAAGVRIRGLMLSAEVALAVLLTVAAGLTVKTLLRLESMDPGFRPAGAVSMDISLPEDYENTDRLSFVQRLLERVERIPGVEAAGITNRLPLSGDNSTRSFSLGSSFQPDNQHMVEMRRISSGFSKAMGIRLLRGRMIGPGDTAYVPGVAVVNDTFAARFSPDRDVLNRTIFLQDGLDARPRQIVGVINSVKHVDLTADALPEVYVPYAERPYPNMSLVVRTRGSAGNVADPVSRIVREIDASIPVVNVRPLADLTFNSMGSQRFRAFLMTAFSSVAVFLAGVGIYGVTAYSVAQRRRELAIRMALGATPGDVILFVLQWCGRWVAAGLVVGTALASMVAFVASRLLFQVSPFDLLVYAPVVLLLAAVATTAALLPAWHAGKAEPAFAQRNWRL